MTVLTLMKMKIKDIKSKRTIREIADITGIPYVTAQRDLMSALNKCQAWLDANPDQAPGVLLYLKNRGDIT